MPMLVNAGLLAAFGAGGEAQAAGTPLSKEQATANDYLVALTVLYEAANQPRLGQELVGRVVVNRAERLGTPHYERVVFAQGQFAAWTEPRKAGFLACQVAGGDPACFDALGLERVCVYNREGCEGRWRHFLDLARGLDADPEGFEGVLYFDNPRFWETGEPPWAPEKERLGCVADHCFWR
jgi:hypothetical protein